MHKNEIIQIGDRVKILGTRNTNIYNEFSQSIRNYSRNFSNKKKKFTFGWNEQEFNNSFWIEAKNIIKLKSSESKWKKHWKDS